MGPGVNSGFGGGQLGGGLSRSPAKAQLGGGVGNLPAQQNQVSGGLKLNQDDSEDDNPIMGPGAAATKPL